MTTDMLDAIASHPKNYHNLPDYHYLGTQGSDQAAALLRQFDKTPTQRPWGMIFNIDPIAKSGQHWIALYGPKGSKRIEIMDSYGSQNLKTAYATYPHVVDILKRVQILEMPRLQQMDTFVCGHYSLAYLYYRTANQTFAHFVRSFRNKNGDRAVYNFVRDVMVKNRRPPSQAGSGTTKSQSCTCAYDCKLC